MYRSMEQQQPPKPYWRFTKNDFFPEPSFESFSTYKSALLQTPHRLRDRVFGRSSDTNELHTLQKQSENPMKLCLTWWDLIWMGFGSVVGSGIFSIAGQEAHIHAGPSIVLSYVVSGLSALLSVFCYTEFSVEIPVAGGSFSFLRIELGDFIAFIAAANIMFEALVGAAGLGRSWSSYFATIIKPNADAFRIKLLKEKGILPELSPCVDNIVCSLDSDLQGVAAAIATKLRGSGQSVDLVLESKPLKWFFKRANRVDAARLVFVGSEEWQKGMVGVKNLSTGEQYETTVDDLE